MSVCRPGSPPEPIWINTNKALQLVSWYRKGPHSRGGLVLHGHKGRFIRRSPDGYHWEFHTIKLKRYYDIANFMSMADIAREYRIDPGILKYISLNNMIQLKKELGRKYLDPADAQTLMNAVLNYKITKEKS